MELALSPPPRRQRAGAAVPWPPILTAPVPVMDDHGRYMGGVQRHFSPVSMHYQSGGTNGRSSAAASVRPSVAATRLVPVDRAIGRLRPVGGRLRGALCHSDAVIGISDGSGGGACPNHQPAASPPTVATTTTTYSDHEACARIARRRARNRAATASKRQCRKNTHYVLEAVAAAYPHLRDAADAAASLEADAAVDVWNGTLARPDEAAGGPEGETKAAAVVRLAAAAAAGDAIPAAATDANYRLPSVRLKLLRNQRYARKTHVWSKTYLKTLAAALLDVRDAPQVMAAGAGMPGAATSGTQALRPRQELSIDSRAPLSKRAAGATPAAVDAARSHSGAYDAFYKMVVAACPLPSAPLRRASDTVVSARGHRGPAVPAAHWPGAVDGVATDDRRWRESPVWVPRSRRPPPGLPLPPVVALPYGQPPDFGNGDRDAAVRRWSLASTPPTHEPAAAVRLGPAWNELAWRWDAVPWMQRPAVEERPPSPATMAVVVSAADALGLDSVATVASQRDVVGSGVPPIACRALPVGGAARLGSALLRVVSRLAVTTRRVAARVHLGGAHRRRNGGRGDGGGCVWA